MGRLIIKSEFYLLLMNRKKEKGKKGKGKGKKGKEKGKEK